MGPVWRGGGFDEERLLASCYRSSLELAAQHGIRRIAFPQISTGAYGFPQREACAIAVQSIEAALANLPSIDQVLCVSYGAAAHQNMLEAIARTG